jgi:hypothetical protein
MTPTARRSWLATILWISTGCLGAPVADSPRAPASPNDARADASFFQTPAINPTDDELRTPSAPHSKIPGFNVGQPAPAYRTLSEAARAGVNPMSRETSPITQLTDTDSAPRRSMVGMAVGIFSLLCIGVGGLIVLMRTHSRAGRSESVPETRPPVGN